MPKGGPDGGDGGRGGDVILRADQHTDQLAALFYEPIIRAKNGVHGQGKKMHGKSAPRKVVNVPVGTVVYRAMQTNDGSATHPLAAANHLPDLGSANSARQTHAVDIQQPSPSEPPAHFQMGEEIADLTRDGEELLLCKGGGGGKGNVHFKSSRNRAPRQYTEGGEGESGYFFLELRTIADAALVGYPNAGKSTLLRRLSAAHPKVAPYPFTTLHPVMGVVDLDNYRRATVADIPGLIEGAHRNLGLGHDFLRHVTRCAVFLFVLDMAGSEGRSPIADLETLRREIDLYDSRLSQRPWFVVANKMDLPEAGENLRAFSNRFPQLTVAPVSGKEGGGVSELKELLGQWIAPLDTAIATAEPINN
ncbi:MAG: GTPase ObgE [Chthoniobacterales bacterium]|nr:MAG: GTPase ObgE [Chthoniobacterales bacterium]